MVSHYLFPYFRHFPTRLGKFWLLLIGVNCLKLDSQSVSLLLNLRPHVFQRNRPVEDELTTLGVGVEGEVGETRTSTPRSLATPPTMMPITCWRPVRTHPARPGAFATRPDWHTGWLTTFLAASADFGRLRAQ